MADVGAPPLALELWINPKTAKPLDLMVPQSILLRGDELIPGSRPSKPGIR
jgi:hypothetical protein